MANYIDKINDNQNVDLLKVLQLLSDHPDSSVRYSLAGNSITPDEVLSKLTNDTDSDVATMANRSLHRITSCKLTEVVPFKNSRTLTTNEVRQEKTSMYENMHIDAILTVNDKTIKLGTKLLQSLLCSYLDEFASPEILAELATSDDPEFGRIVARSKNIDCETVSR